MDRHRDHYQLVDLRLANQLGGALWICAAIYVLVLRALEPATRTATAPGWGVVAACTGFAFVVGALRLLRGSSSPALLVATAHASVVLIAVVTTVPRDPAPYGNLLFLVAGYCAFLHPAGRLLGILAAASVAALVPVVLGLDDTAVAEAVGQVVLLNGIAAMVFAASHSARKLRLEVMLQRSAAEDLARVDALTGLGNRRALDEALVTQREVVARTGRPLSVLVADLDHFKAINDVAGHQAGDRILAELAAVLRDALRLGDAAFRWGGDEFVVLLGDTGRAEADEIGERLRAAVGERLTRPDGTPVTLSLGAAELRPDESGRDLLARADALLVQVKAARRTASV